MLASTRRSSSKATAEIGHGSVLIAAITSCTNTSNPSVMLAAGLLAKKAVERGLTVNPSVKTSLAPGSRVVTDYLNKTGLQPYLDQLGFNTVGYGCTTCIGNSGPLDPAIEEAITRTISSPPPCSRATATSRRACTRTSRRTSSCRRRSSWRSRSPAGSTSTCRNEPLGKDKDGKDVYLRDSGRRCRKSATRCEAALKPEVFRRSTAISPHRIRSGTRSRRARATFTSGTEEHLHPGAAVLPGFRYGAPARSKTFSDARPLGIFGDSVTTDHISPAGAIKKTRPPGNT